MLSVHFSAPAWHVDVLFVGYFLGYTAVMDVLED
jgi:hypothetical protein